MNDRERRFSRRVQKASLNTLLIDFLETQRSGLSDSLMTNRRGCSFYVEFKSVDQKVKPTSCPFRNIFEKGQLAFLRERKTWGAPAFVLIELGKEVLLLNPDFDLEAVTNYDLKESIASGCKVGPVLAVGMSHVITILSITTVNK